ncbi:MAG: DUF1223 domain-containing protein [Rhodobacteraceae bacterium]|nr:DUF1223 domain-containing protein [Paracoccaceae bacterium]
MMRHFIGGAFAALGLFAASLQADEQVRSPVVVELFTSQGCSSCPPADALLHDLAEHEDVIALSLHVDYWDYIGWKDSFAKAAFTERQKSYARSGQRPSIYTPQMIIDGRDALVGHDAMKIIMKIEEHKRAPKVAVIKVISRNADDTVVQVRLEPRVSNAPAGDVQLVRYTPNASVDIRRGENAGHKLSYANVVREWTNLGRWDGAEAEMKVDVPGPDPAVLILQAEGQRDVLAAARLK